MNGTTYSQDPSMGFYTGNGPITTFTTNANLHQLYPSNNNIQRPIHSNNNQQSTTANIYNFANGGSTSADYYNRIHAQIRTNTPAIQSNLNSTNNQTNSNAQKLHVHSPTPYTVKQPTTPAVSNGHKEPTFLVVPAADMNGTISPFQVVHKNYFRDRSY
jgi:hypothetical protein